MTKKTIPVRIRVDTYRRWKDSVEREGITMAEAADREVKRLVGKK